jgi:hypothetical protein
MSNLKSSALPQAQPHRRQFETSQPRCQRAPPQPSLQARGDAEGGELKYTHANWHFQGAGRKIFPDFSATIPGLRFPENNPANHELAVPFTERYWLLNSLLDKNLAF